MERLTRVHGGASSTCGPWIGRGTHCRLAEMWAFGPPTPCQRKGGSLQQTHRANPLGYLHILEVLLGHSRDVMNGVGARQAAAPWMMMMMRI
mmetsp:Transcript_22391/g.53663  ORF Transcript_22391/g.53663 Transcript_22391/m.53663 type:complete len:92 (+) Transcript_22391:457-732(+)